MERKEMETRAHPVHDQAVVQPLEAGERIPVYLLTGFLGSGKTTFLQKAIDHYILQGKRPAVVMNELGDVNLDGMLLDAGVPMRELLNGCICCTVRGDLAEALKELVSGEKPDVVFVESTGAANPADLLDAATDLTLVQRLEFRDVIALVDGPAFLDRYRRLGSKGRTMKLLQIQVQYATLVLMNKIDRLAQPGDLPELERALRSINSRAPILASVYGGMDMGLLDATRQTEPARAGGSRWMAAIEQPPTSAGSQPVSDGEADGGTRSDAGHGGGHGAHPAVRSARTHEQSEEDKPRYSHDARSGDGDHSHRNSGHTHHSHAHVMVMTHYFHAPVNRERFEALLRSLPGQVLRAKGLVRFTDAPERVMFQYAFGETVFIPMRRQLQIPDTAVLIGEALPVQMLELLLQDVEG
ncbi:CobW family GTP-binding protein [Paenibacillus sp. y28]|uniref:CobW family GTP-binding protein n=1 Tax=Paenibacillus sp. y28 TaxID=3129110 RepID=UPI003017CC7E